MRFTYDSYKSLIELLRNNSYDIVNYKNYTDSKKCAILRHDIDHSIDYALQMAELEYNMGVQSTFFILLTSNSYNIFSVESRKKIKQILSYGHTIGLHFDELKYSDKSLTELESCIKYEVNVLSSEIGETVDIVSMHRPSKVFLDSNLKISGVLNSYSKEFIDNFKYVSDSRKCWREDIEKIVASNSYEKLHILTHAIWYKNSEISMKDIMIKFLDDKKHEIYNNVKNNIRDFENILNEDEI